MSYSLLIRTDNALGKVSRIRDEHLKEVNESSLAEGDEGKSEGEVRA